MSPNLRAFLSTIAICEVGTDGPEGYTVLYGGSHFSGFADHPRKAITAGKYTSTAAGRYQILQGTWQDYCKAKGPHDFSPASQDDCAVWLITRRRALEDVEAGRIADALTKCSREWASLPGSPYGQPTRTLAYCLAAYQKAGGTVASPGQPQPASAPRIVNPEQEAPVLPALIGPLLSIAAQAVPVIAQILQPKTEVAQRNTKLLEVAADTLVKSVNAVNLQEAAEKVTTDAAAAATANAALAAQPDIAAFLSQVAPVLQQVQTWQREEWDAEDKSRQAAMDRANALAFTSPVFVLAAAILAMVAGVVFTVLYRQGFSTDMQSFVIGAVVGSAFTAVLQFFFGSSRSSAAKDAVIDQLARK